MSRREAESSKTYAGDIGLHSWITTKVSQILLENLPSIISRITDRMISKFEEITATFQNVGETVEATMG